MSADLTRRGWMLGLALVALVAPRGVAADASAQPDLSAWQAIPVYYVEDGAQRGRMMPLDTFAREMVELICHKQSPTLSMAKGVGVSELNAPRLDKARGIFPDGGKGSRRYPAAELLLSWLAQPEAWEDVPFINATFEDLRTQLLGLKIKDDETKVPFTGVSPRQVEQADAFWDHLAKLSQRHAEAQATGKEVEETALDKRAHELYKAYVAYRLLTTDPTRDNVAVGLGSAQIDRREFRVRLQKIIDPWKAMRDGLSQVNYLSEELAQAETAVHQLAELAGKGRFTAAEAEAPAVAFRQATKTIADRMERDSAQMRDNPPKDATPDQLLAYTELFARFKMHSRRLADGAYQLHMSIYDDGCMLGVLPALSAPALRRERQPEDDFQPWISLPALLHGTPAALAGYPNERIQYSEADLAAARDTYRQLTSAYLTDPAKAAAAAEDFAKRLAALGGEVETGRAELVKPEDRDLGLLAYTAYPPPGSTTAEVIYNKTQPFMWSWIVALGAVACFALSFGLARKGMFWLGVVILVAAVGWTIYGFYLRVIITGWAPVTNMYETVLYVPFVVAILGLWFTFLPATWQGLKNAWRLTAVPGTWESTELEKEQSRLADESFWRRGNYLFVVPRVALMALTFWVLTQAPYAAGERTIINLVPNREVGESLPNLNDTLTWTAGMLVLIPTMWYLPRLVLTMLAALVTIPWTLRGRFSKALAEVYPRRVFAMSAGVVAAGLWMLASYAPVLDDRFSPLQPVLRDNFWLTIHVLTIVSSYGAGLLAYGLAMTAMGYYLFGHYRPGGRNGSKRPPEATLALAGYAYKAIQVAVLLLATGTLLGALWADVSWGRFWGWDPKEVWALISLLAYLAILHGRYAGLFGNFGLHFGAILGATAIAMSWYGVNFVLGAGLHSYGFGDGGQVYVGGYFLATWLLWVAPAGLRYWWNCSLGFAEATSVEDTATPSGAAPSA